MNIELGGLRASVEVGREGRMSVRLIASYEVLVLALCTAV